MAGVNFLRTYGGRSGANIGPSKTCMFIAGEAPYGPSPWCGAPSLPDKSWCAEHHARCYRTMNHGLQRDFERGYHATALRSK